MDNRFGTTSGMVIQTVMENGQELCLPIDERPPPLFRQPGHHQSPPAGP